MRDPLSRVTEGIYQVGGADAPHLTIVEGDRGVIIVDPSRGATLDLYRERRGDRPVTGVIYTHPHADPRDGFANGDVPILAPAGCLAHGVSEITRTGQEETLDRVRIVFQLGTGVNLLFPQRQALFLARNAGTTSHHLLTETIVLFGGFAEVLFGSHQRPIRGQQDIMRYLSEQRDVHAYLHDQTLRLLGKGHTGAEIAELIQLPPVLEKAWHDGGYAGSWTHSVKAIYQRHLGWFDGNPAGLWQRPPAEAANRYVESLGGAGEVVAKAREFVDSGDLRFAARMLQHADPEDAVAKELLAWVYERLGRGTEDPAWREFFRTSAQELRCGTALTPAQALSLEQIFDTVAIRVDAQAAWHEIIVVDWLVEGEPYRTTLRHGVLIHHPVREIAVSADLTLRLTKGELLGLLAGQGLDGIACDGDPEALKRLLSHLDSPFVPVA